MVASTVRIWARVFLLGIGLAGCSWDVEVGPVGRYADPSPACVAGLQEFYDAGAGVVVDRMGAVIDERRGTSLYVALHGGGVEEVRRLAFNAGQPGPAMTVARAPGESPFTDFLARSSGSAYFAHADRGVVGSVVGTAADGGAELAPDEVPVPHPRLLGFVRGAYAASLAVQSDANVLALDEGSPHTLATGVLAAFPWTFAPSVDVLHYAAQLPWSFAEWIDYLNYAEATADGVVLHSVNFADPRETTSVTLPDADPASFTAILSVGRLLYFQYAPKGTSPASLPLLSVDLASSDLGPSAPARQPRVVTPALAARQTAILRTDAWIIATHSSGDFARVSLQDGAVKPMPELAGATAFTWDDCNLYWVKAGSSVVMAEPLPAGAK